MLTVRLAGRAVLACGVVLALTGCTSISRSNLDELQRVLPAPPTRPSLADCRVLQRDEANEGTLYCEQPCDLEGQVFGRVLANGQPLPGLDWRLIGRAADGTCVVTLRRIPVGGPYRVELEVRDADGHPLTAWSADHVLVGDIWILAGQSNMEGRGDLTDAETPSPLVCCYGLNERWSIAEEPLHWLNESLDPAHHAGQTPAQAVADVTAPRTPRAKGAGLGLPFAKELYARTGVPVGLVPCAHRGTAIEQWDPVGAALGARSLYGSMLRRFQAVGGHVRGVLWYQGEDDAHPVQDNAYGVRLEQLIAAVRRDFGDPRLQFHIVQLARTVNYPQADDYWAAIREQQRHVAEELPNVEIVTAIDLPLEDGLHVATPGLKELGRRLALVACHELLGEQVVRPGPRLRRVVVEDADRGIVRVCFDDANGRLRPDDNIVGFSLRGPTPTPTRTSPQTPTRTPTQTPTRTPTPGLAWALRTGPHDVQTELHNVYVDPARPDTVICRLGMPIRPGVSLCYGYGRNPACNLTDEQNLPAPTFGPIPLLPPDGRQVIQAVVQSSASHSISDQPRPPKPPYAPTAAKPNGHGRGRKT
jgi:sialate O-acetylesterase